MPPLFFSRWDASGKASYERADDHKSCRGAIRHICKALRRSDDCTSDGTSLTVACSMLCVR